MTIKEGYLAKLKTYPQDEIKIVVTRTAKSVLSPSWNLINDYKTGRINWEEYTERFIQAMNNPTCQTELQRIKELARDRTVRLICYEKQYPCHRFILLKLLEDLP